MDATPGRPRFVLTLEALPCEVAPHLRLRSALKRLLRAFRLRCLRVEELPAGGDTETPETGEQR
jgi:hypothetical protein